MNVTCFTIIWDTIKHMTNIKLLKLNDFCGTFYQTYLCLMHISIDQNNICIYRIGPSWKENNNSLASCNIKRSAYYLLIKQTKFALLTNNNAKSMIPLMRHSSNINVLSH